MRSLQKSLLRIRELLHPDNHDPQFAPDLFLGDAYILPQPVGLDLADDEQVDEARILAQGVIIQDEHRVHVTQVRTDFLDDPVDAQALFDDGMQLRKNGVAGVGPEEEGAALFLLFEVAGLSQAIELFLDGVGGDGEFRGQLPQIAGDVGVEEELQEKLDACLGGEKLREHGDFVQLF